MNSLLISASCFLTAVLYVMWMRTRFERSLARLERMYASQQLTASLVHPEQVTDLPLAEDVDDRQMNLFGSVTPPILQMSAPMLSKRSHPFRRRADRPASERLDWQYFNKDHGDLAYPAAKERRRTAAAGIPRRRA